MTKETAINELIEKVYSYSGKLVISKKDIKKIEEYYKANYLKHSTLKSFMDSDATIAKLIDELKSGKSEIRKQLNKGKALQPGILAECVFLQTLASIFGLRTYIDFETDPAASVPIVLNDYMKSSTNTICAARYAYCNKKNSDVVIFQYGNPKAGDSIVILYKNEIVIEIKDMPAVLKEIEIEYDEFGKIIITDKIKQEQPEYIRYIEEFNQESDIISRIKMPVNKTDGKINYKIFKDDGDSEKRGTMLQHFFEAANVDIILTTTKKDELIAIKSKDIGYIFPDGTPLIYTLDSEIRPCGKNKYKPFTPDFLKQVLQEENVQVQPDGTCILMKDDKDRESYGRGKGKVVTRLNLNRAFFVPIDKVSVFDDYYQFKKEDIKQKKGNMSIHLEINKNRKQIKDNLYK